MLPVAVCGLLINLVGLVFFYDVHAHSHSHGGAPCSLHNHHGRPAAPGGSGSGGGGGGVGGGGGTCNHGHSHGHHHHGHAADVEGGEGDGGGGGGRHVASHDAAAGEGNSIAEGGNTKKRRGLAQAFVDWVMRVLRVPMEQDMNMRGVFLHILADAVGSASVIVSSLLIQFFDWHWFDGVCAAFTAGASPRGGRGWVGGGRGV